MNFNKNMKLNVYEIKEYEIAVDTGKLRNE